MQQEAAAGGSSGGRDSGPASAGWMGEGWVSMGALAPGESLEEALAGAASGGASYLDVSRCWSGLWRALEGLHWRPHCCLVQGRSSIRPSLDGPTQTPPAAGNPDAPTAALIAGDPAALRRELLKRVRARMDDRAQAGMQADPVGGSCCFGCRFCCWCWCWCCRLAAWRAVAALPPAPAGLPAVQLRSSPRYCASSLPTHPCIAGPPLHAWLPRTLLHKVLRG